MLCIDSARSSRRTGFFSRIFFSFFFLFNFFSSSSRRGRVGRRPCRPPWRATWADFAAFSRREVLASLSFGASQFSPLLAGFCFARIRRHICRKALGNCSGISLCLNEAVFAELQSAVSNFLIHSLQTAPKQMARASVVATVSGALTQMTVASDIVSLYQSR